MNNPAVGSMPPVFRLMLAFVGALLVCGLALGPRAAAQGSPAASGFDPSVLDARVAAIMAENNLPGVAVALVQDGRLVYQRGYGEAAPGKPVTPQTQFYIGSVSKSFTALAVMRLAEEGKIDLDSPVGRYLPEFAVADADASARITVRHLLNQTSGLSPAGDPRASAYFPTLADQVSALRDVTPTAPVGAKFQYYNQNYRVLGLLIERVSGQTYGEYLRANVIAPLGLTRTVTNPADAPDLSRGHGQFFGFPLPRDQEYRPSALPSGYVISSAEDMGRYMVALLDGARVGDRQIVRPESLALLQNPPAGTDSQYGMGWVISNQAEGKIVYHDGALENYYAQVVLLPERRLGLVFLANQYGVLPLVNGLRALGSEVGDVLLDQPVQPVRTFNWVAYLIGALFVADTLNNVRRLVLMPRWNRQTAGRPRALRWALAVGEFLVPLALLIGLPALVSAALHEQGGWGEMYGVAPDLTVWILVGLGFAVVRGAAKVAIVARARRAVG